MNPLIRALYDVPVFRGSTKPGAQARGKWWALDPNEARQYAGTWGSPEGSNTIPGQLDTRDFEVLDANNADYTSIPLSVIRSRPRLVEALSKHFYTTADKLKSQFITDEIAIAAEQAGIPGVIFRNVQDALPHPSTQIYVADPRRRRSRFAKFEDSNSDDLMAQLTLALTGLGGAGLASNQEEET